MDQPPKKSRKPGSGGARPGAGRKSGGRNALPLGFIPAIKAMRHRADHLEPELQEVAARAFEKLVDVMEERVHFTAAGHVLKAATLLREEVCGPMAQKMEHTGPDGAALQIIVNTLPPEEGTE